MGLGRAIRRSAEATFNFDGGSFSSSEFINLAQSRTGIAGTKEELAGLTTVYRAINLLANTQSILKLKAFRKADGVSMPSPMLESPSPNWTFTCSEWRDYELRSRLMYGNSYALKGGMTAQSPWPRYLYPIHPTRVIPYGVFDRGVLKDVMYLIQPAYHVNVIPPGFDDAMKAVDLGAMWLGRSDIFHVPGVNFDGVSGQSPIDACAAALAIELATEIASGKFFAKGQLLSGFLKTVNRLDEKQAKALKNRWNQKMSGVDNAFDVAVMDNGLEFQPLSVSPEQSQFIQMRQFNVEQVARIFGIPPFLLMSESKASSFGTGLEQQLIATDIFTLSYWFTALEDRVSMELLPSTQSAKFDKSPLERADLKSRHASYAIARTNSYMSINEIRAIEGLPPVDDPDANDPMLPPAKNSGAADTPGGNAGLQGGGDQAAPDVVA